MRDAPNSSELTAIGTQAVTTNANGNITGIAYSTAIGFTYNKANSLATVTSGGGTVLSYVYDGFGQRITKTDTAQRFQAYDQSGRFIEQTDNTDTVKQDYIYLNGMPVATFVPNASTGTLSFLHTDRLGTPRLATSSTKAVGWSATASDPFNAPNSVSGNTIANDLRMPGQEYELGSGHNHNGFRDYAPALGRYLQSDPIGLDGGINSYAYVSSNPARWTDHSGLLLEAPSSPQADTPTLDSAKCIDQLPSAPLLTLNDNPFLPSPNTDPQPLAFQIAGDGGIYKNLGPGDILPIQPFGYYTIQYVKEPGQISGGQVRLVLGAGGEVYYTDDHYMTFVQIK